MSGNRSKASWRIGLTLLLCCCLCLGWSAPARAASSEALSAADSLHELGLFAGVGADESGRPIYELDRRPTRAEAVTMLVRLLGAAEEAKAGSWQTPFCDVPEWAQAYVGYAYANRLTFGVSDTAFGSAQTVTASEYLTFVLRSLGYQSGRDYAWDKAWALTDALGLTEGQYNSATNKSFTRGDVAIVSLAGHQAAVYQAQAVYFGLPEGIRWRSAPVSQADYENNILYSFLLGHYRLDLRFPSQEAGREFARQLIAENGYLQRLTASYPELMGAYCNGQIRVDIVNGVDSISVVDAALTDAELFDRQQQALREAQRISAVLHQNGVLDDSSSQYEIAQTYYDFLRSLNVSVSGLSESASDRGRYMLYDSAYACLLLRRADCVGRAAAFDLLLHIEGIPAQSVFGFIDGYTSGHVLNRVLLDGQEYFCDWGNGRPLCSYDEMARSFRFDAASLAMARSR